MKKQTKDNFTFTAEHFWEIIKNQKKRCALTGRELSPQNTQVELSNPRISIEEGRAKFENHYIVCKELSPTARNISEEEIIDIAIEIIQYRGIERGLKLTKVKK